MRITTVVCAGILACLNDSNGMRNPIAFDLGGATAKAGVMHAAGVRRAGTSLVGGFARRLGHQWAVVHFQEVRAGGGRPPRAARPPRGGGRGGAAGPPYQHRSQARDGARPQYLTAGVPRRGLAMR